VIDTSAGQTGIGQFTVDSGQTPSLFSISVEGGGWLQLRGITAASSSPDGRYSTPAVVTVSATATQPGVQYGSVTLTTSRGKVQVPVTYYFTASIEFPPTVSVILGAASLRPGPLAPGEIFTIFGSGVGPFPKVLVDNLIAPVLFASSNQINAIVPYHAERFSGTARVQVISGDDAASSEWSVTEAASAPAIFTLSGSGVGQAAVLNQDNSVNGAGNPAARGSVIQIFATGEGQTSPAGVTGSVNHGVLPTPLLPVQVAIGGVDALLQYQGAAPDAVAGLLQVNAVVPATVAIGTAVPITLTVGGVKSPSGATVAVR
jgi:uncharacterized protein (TIGR03437 family)